MRDKAVTHGEHGKGACRLAQWHAVAEHANGQPPHNVDGGDDDAGNGVPTHKLGCTVHGAVKSAFLFQLLALDAGGALVDRAGGQVRVNGHLLARNGVQEEAGRHFGNTPRAFGDDHKVHHQQDAEDNAPDHHIPTHEEPAEGGHHMTCGIGAFAPVAQNKAGGCNFERQAQKRGQQQQCGEGGKVQRALKEQRHHQHQHRGRDGDGQPHVQNKSGQRQDKDGQQKHNADRQPDVRTGEHGAPRQGFPPAIAQGAGGVGQHA